MSAGVVVGLRNCNVVSPAGSASNANRPSSPVTTRVEPPAITATPGMATRSPLRSTSPVNGSVGADGAAATGTGAGGGAGRK